MLADSGLRLRRHPCRSRQLWASDLDQAMADTPQPEPQRRSVHRKTTSRSTTPLAASPAPTVSPPASATPASPRSRRSVEVAPSSSRCTSATAGKTFLVTKKRDELLAANRRRSTTSSTKLPTTAPHGRTLHRLARRRQPPPLPTPRRRPQPPRPQHPSRRHQPPTPPQPRPRLEQLATRYLNYQRSGRQASTMRRPAHAPKVFFGLAIPDRRPLHPRHQSHLLAAPGRSAEVPSRAASSNVGVGRRRWVRLRLGQGGAGVLSTRSR